MTAGLKAGTLVYRVVEVDPYGEGPHTWRVACIEIEHASARQIKLKTYPHGLTRKVFKPDIFGRTFFETPLQALQFFLIKQRFEIESLDRKKKEVERAITWATSQEGMTP